MSNAMSISKSRWKGALLATVAASVLTPLAASAQTTAGSMTLSLSLAPMGKVIAGHGFGTAEYIAPDQSYPIYVYATVAESGNVSSSNVAGLQFAYFNVLQNYVTNLSPANVNATGVNTSDGTITVASTSPLFSAYGSQNGATGATSGYYGVGTGAPIGGQSATIGLASSTSMSLMGKARSTSPVWSNSVSGTGDGTNIYISGNQVSFLLETLTYTPSFNNNPYGTGSAKLAARSWNDPDLGENSFTINVPNLPTPYVGANYFTGNPNGSTGSEHNGSVGTSYTHSAYAAGSVTVGGYTFSSTVGMYDAALGDAALDGYMGSDSLVREGISYSFVNNTGNILSGWTNGDYYNDGYVGGDSLVQEGIAYSSGVNDPSGNSGAYGPILLANGAFGTPASLVGGSSVPEPASLSLLALASLGLTLGRRSRKSV